MPVGPVAEVDLRERVEPVQFEQVDQVAHLDTVMRDERDAFEHFAPSRVLTGERLDETGQLGPVHIEQRTRDEFGDPATAVGFDARHPGERTVVEPFDVGDPRVGQQRSEQSGHVVRGEVAEIAVDEDDEVPAGFGDALPERFSLTRQAFQLREHRILRDDVRPGRRGHLGGRVRGMAVHHQDLVDEGKAFDEFAPDGADDRAHRLRLVAGRDHHRNPRPAFGGDQLRRPPVTRPAAAPREPRADLRRYPHGFPFPRRSPHR